MYISRPVKGRLEALQRSNQCSSPSRFVLAAACLVPALAKLLSHPKMLASASHFGIPWARYRLIGVAELAAAAGVLAGLAWAPLGVAAASGMALLLLGALTVHRRAGDRLQEAAPALLALAISLAYLAVARHRLTESESLHPYLAGVVDPRRRRPPRRCGSLRRSWAVTGHVTHEKTAEGSAQFSRSRRIRWAWEWTPSLEKIDDRWLRTVLWLTYKSAAM